MGIPLKANLPVGYGMQSHTGPFEPAFTLPQTERSTTFDPLMLLRPRLVNLERRLCNEAKNWNQKMMQSVAGLPQAGHGRRRRPAQLRGHGLRQDGLQQRLLARLSDVFPLLAIGHRRNGSLRASPEHKL